MTGLARASDPQFTVTDVEVDVTSDNALTAREKAFDQAQSKAFTMLAERMALQDDSSKPPPTPDPITLAAMIEDYEVTQEKLSNVRYIGTYTFRFKDSAVKSFFSQSNVQYTDKTSDTLMLLPFYQADGRSDLWSDGNEWKQAWDRIESNKGLVPLIVPTGDLDDVRNIGDDDATDYSAAELESMMERYGTRESVIAIAIPDSEFLQSEASAARGTIKIDLYRTDRFKAEQVQQVFVNAVSGQSRAAVFDEAVRSVKKALQNNWKEKNIAAAKEPSGFGNQMVAHLPINSLAEWMRLQNLLKSVPSVQGIKVNTLTPKKVMATLTYHVDLEQFKSDLQRVNITTKALPAPANLQSTGNAPHYELRIVQSAAPALAPAANTPAPSSPQIPNTPAQQGYQQSF